MSTTTNDGDDNPSTQWSETTTPPGSGQPDQVATDDDDRNHQMLNERTVNSISELAPYHLLCKPFTSAANPAEPIPMEAPTALERLFQTPPSSSLHNRMAFGGTSGNRSEISSSRFDITVLDGVESLEPIPEPAEPHPLTKLPEQLDTLKTKMLLKRIASQPVRQSWCFRAQRATYNFFNYPNTIWAYLYHSLVAITLIPYIGVVMFTQRTTWMDNCYLYPARLPLKNSVEWFIYSHFVLEFFLRFWCSRAHVSYQNLTAIRWLLRYFSRPSHLFDILLVVGGGLSVSCFIPQLPVDFTQDLYALITLRGMHRLFNAVRWASLQSRQSPWALIGEVIHDDGAILMVMFNVCILFILVVSYLVFLAETHPDNDHRNMTSYSNLMDSIYATTITLLTVGYGDLSPVTYAGQAITGISIWIALVLLTLPGGLIGTSVALKVSEQEERRKRKIRKTLAAILVQRAWRFTRRQRQFEMAQIMDEMRKGNQIEVNLPIRTNEALWTKIDRLLADRGKFHASQFIQLILVRRARSHFRGVILPDDPRAAIKIYQTRNREIAANVERVQTRMEDAVNVLQNRHDYQQEQMQWIEHRLQLLDEQVRQQHFRLRQLVSGN